MVLSGMWRNGPEPANKVPGEGLQWEKGHPTTQGSGTVTALEAHAVKSAAEARERQRRLVMATLDFIDQHRPQSELRGEWVASKLDMKPTSINYEWRMRGMALPDTKKTIELLRLCIEEVGRSWL